MKDILILLVPAHHKNTKGKQSPDGRLKEYQYSREIINRVIKNLTDKGYTAINPIPETEEELPLSEQCKIINNISLKESAKDCICISPHINAAGNGSEWMNARGWSCFIYRGASEKTKELAGCLEEAAKEEGLKIRYEYPGVPYWVSGLYICKNTIIPCVLTESLFQDNKDDVDFLLSEEGKEAITNLHVQGILKYINNNENEQNLQ